jgi:hypothetical protein
VAAVAQRRVLRAAAQVLPVAAAVAVAWGLRSVGVAAGGDGAAAVCAGSGCGPSGAPPPVSSGVPVPMNRPAPPCRPPPAGGGARTTRPAIITDTRTRVQRTH